MKQLFDYTLLRWKTFIIYGVTKFCTPKGKPKIVKSRQFKIFDTKSFHADLSLAPWHLVHLEGNPNRAWEMWLPCTKA